VSRSKYETHVLPFLDKISEWAKQGATGKEIAQKLGIAYSSFKLYLSKAENGDEAYSALSACYRQACVVADDEVEAALFKRACGFEYEEVKTEERFNPKTGQIIKVTTTTTKMVPPEPTSAMFWLANRRRDRWQYRPDDSSSGGDAPGETSGVIELAAVMPQPEEAQA